MFDYEVSGFKFCFDENKLLLTSNLFGMTAEEQDRLLNIIRELRPLVRSLCATGHLRAASEDLITELNSSKRYKSTTLALKGLLLKYDTEAGRAQIETWFSYMLEMAPCDLDLDSDIMRLWDILEEAKAFDARYMEYNRYRKISERYPTAHHGYVYLFLLSTGHYKIGFSNNPQRRGREITSGLPFTLEIIHQIPSNQIACLEHELHEQFKNKRHGTTEWFELDDSDVTAIKSITGRTYPWIDNPEWGEEFKTKSTFFNMRPLGSSPSPSS